MVNSQGKIVAIVTESDFAAKEKGGVLLHLAGAAVVRSVIGKARGRADLRSGAHDDRQGIVRTRVITVTEEQWVEDVLEIILHHDTNRVPVVRDGMPVGIDARHNLLKLMAQQERGGFGSRAVENG